MGLGASSAAVHEADARGPHGVLGEAAVFEDARGKLTLLPLDEAPFETVRAYVLSDLPAGARRGGHACRTQHRFLICISGRAVVTLDDGRSSQQIALSATQTLLVRPGVWLELEATEASPVLVVLADGEYDPGDYVSDRAALPIAAVAASHTRSA